MPRTRHILDYPICRLFLRLGLAWQCWMRELPEVRPVDQPETERELEEILRLPDAVAAGLLGGWAFRWNDRGRLVDFQPHPARQYKDTPGLHTLRLLYFPRLPRMNVRCNPYRKQNPELLRRPLDL